jgi:hypothetical protein
MASVSVSAKSRPNFVNIAQFHIKTQDKTVFTTEDRIFKKSLYLLKAHNITRLPAEIPHKNRNKQ